MTKVYFANVTPLSDSRVFDAAIKRVSLKRQNKVNSLKQQNDKILSLGAGLVFDYAVKDFTGTSPAPDISYEKCGKPFIEGNKNIFVSISHSGEYALCAVSHYPIGADIQNVTGFKEDISQRFFLKSEADFIFRTQNDCEKNKKFFKIWTLKEAYSKMTGKGVMSFKEFEICLIPEIKVKKDGIFLPAEFFECEIPNYKIAVCVGVENKNITFENISQLLIN